MPPANVHYSMKATVQLSKGGQNIRTRLLDSHERRKKTVGPRLRLSTYRVVRGAPSSDVVILDITSRGQRHIRVFTKREMDDALQSVRRANQRQQQKKRVSR